MLPTFLNKINVIKVVKVILEIFKLDKRSCIIQEHFIPYIFFCLQKLYGPIVMLFVLHFKLPNLKSLKFCQTIYFDKLPS